MTHSNRMLLGVNIDHVATLRQARGTRYPDPVKAALDAEEAGADGITVRSEDWRASGTATSIGLLLLVMLGGIVRAIRYSNRFCRILTIGVSMNVFFTCLVSL